MEEVTLHKDSKVCKQCLLRDMVGELEGNYSNHVKSYLEGLNPEIKANSESYEKRLELCQQCDLLLDGLCRACGCFVEMRAAIIKNKCPYKKW